MEEIVEKVDLYFYNARHYDPEICRFVTADSIVPYENETQSWNRFSYTRNNPIIYKDPTGHLEYNVTTDDKGNKSGEWHITKGDTLSSISKETGASVEQLAKLNNIKNKDKIYAGDKIKIPELSNIKTYEQAKKEEGNKEWNYQGNEGSGPNSNKCNVFANEMNKRAGNKEFPKTMPEHNLLTKAYREYKDAPLLADDLAKVKQKDMPGYKIKDKALIGDTVVWGDSKTNEGKHVTIQGPSGKQINAGSKAGVIERPKGFVEKSYDQLRVLHPNDK